MPFTFNFSLDKRNEGKEEENVGTCATTRKMVLHQRVLNAGTSALNSTHFGEKCWEKIRQGNANTFYWV